MQKFFGGIVMHKVNLRPKLINVGGLMMVFVLILLMSSIKTSSVLPAAAQETGIAEIVYGSVSGPGFFLDGRCRFCPLSGLLQPERHQPRLPGQPAVADTNPIQKRASVSAS